MSPLVISLAVLLVALYLVSGFITLLYRQARSPLRRLCAPTPAALTSLSELRAEKKGLCNYVLAHLSAALLGNLPEMHDAENTDLIAQWQEKFGDVFVYRGFLGGYRLMLLDERAIAHVLGHAYDVDGKEGGYEKPEFVRESLAMMAAGREGLLTTEGEVHRRQRKILTPAFSATHLRSLAPIFCETASKLRDIWLAQADSAVAQASSSNPNCDHEVGRSTASPNDNIATPPSSNHQVQETQSILPKESGPNLAGCGMIRRRRPAERQPGEEERQKQKKLPSLVPTGLLAPAVVGRAVGGGVTQVGGCGKGGTRVDALIGLARATLDAIGLAGFGYNFNSLDVEASRHHLQPQSDEEDLVSSYGKDELAQAFSIIFSNARRFRVMAILQAWFPWLRRFRRNSKTMQQARETMRRIGLGLIEERERESVTVDEGKENYIRGMVKRDLLSVLIRSNRDHRNTSTFLYATPTPASSAAENYSSLPHYNPLSTRTIPVASTMSMSTNEILSQISTFIAAGHETTASALTWCLYALARDEKVQAQLREAILSVQRESREGEDGDEWIAAVEKCDYLDWVVRETLRLHAPVTSTMRVCMAEEDEIPVSQVRRVAKRTGKSKSWEAVNAAELESDDDPDVEEEGGYLDAEGVRRFAIHVKKWDIISIPIQAINKSRRVWGEDAGVFRPDRWAVPTSRAKAIPGLYSNMLTFLNGSRACIGYKFALLEIKLFLYVLIKDVEFSIDPSLVIEKTVNVVTRPFVKSEPHLGNQMPLLVRRAPKPSSGRGGLPGLPHSDL